MNLRRTTGALAILPLLATFPAFAVDADVKAAAKATTAAFSTTSYVAKLDLRRYAHHYVLPDGSPSTKKGEKKQGRGGEGAIQFDDGVKVHAGEVGESLYVLPKKKELWVCFNKKRGALLNPAIVHVLFDRPVAADDITPEKIARAVSSVAVIKGYEPGADIAAAFDEVLAAEPRPAEAAPAPGRSDRPTVASLRVWAEPAKAPPGGTVELKLEYEVLSPGGEVEAVETRVLTLEGATLPTYPVVDRLKRGAGSFTSSYRQPLPAGARPGTYSLAGEVCVGTDCIRRTATFEVSRP